MKQKPMLIRIQSK